MMDSTQPVTYAEIFRRAKEMHEQIRAWRREIHRHPELTFTEHRTAGLVNATLMGLGVETETEVAKTGVVGHIRGGAGPVVGLRADMDALPIREINGTEFDSTIPGVMRLRAARTRLSFWAPRPSSRNWLTRTAARQHACSSSQRRSRTTRSKSGGMRMVEEGAGCPWRGLRAASASRWYGGGALRTITAAADDSPDVNKPGRPRTHAQSTDRLAAHAVMAIQQIVSRVSSP